MDLAELQYAVIQPASGRRERIDVRVKRRTEVDGVGVTTRGPPAGNAPLSSGHVFRSEQDTSARQPTLPAESPLHAPLLQSNNVLGCCRIGRLRWVGDSA